MFIQTEETPNPNALKFFPETEISPVEPVFFDNIDQAINKSDLACKIFHVGDITAVFYGTNFITVTKHTEANWSVLKPEILVIIMDHLVSGLPVFDASHGSLSANEADQIAMDDLSDIEKQIVEIINSRVRPSVAMDGGDIIYQGFKDGIVYLKLQGACSGCPSSSITLKNGIESMLKHFVPEVQSVEATNE